MLFPARMALRFNSLQVSSGRVTVITFPLAISLLQFFYYISLLRRKVRKRTRKKTLQNGYGVTQSAISQLERSYNHRTEALGNWPEPWA